jgi:septum formation protein
MIHPIIVPMRIVLASASPRRAELLRAAGYEFDTVAVDLDESPRPGEAADAYVRRLAVAKAAGAVTLLDRSSRPEDAGEGGGRGAASLLVLGADTAVVVDGAILGKPRDDRDAASMLERLSGHTHTVLTGVCIRSGRREAVRVEATAVEFRRLHAAEVEWYVRSGEGRDKAGGYAIQGLASRFIPRIDGSYSNVVGLPVAAVHELVVEIASDPLSGLSYIESIPRKSL